ncbi:MAG TPA: hypothetical protein VLF14_12610 [Candidatus Binatia bacterium]|nr:hypothetical protein [Candidatus Binatia bacterium]
MAQARHHAESAQSIPGARLMVIEGMGHDVPLQARARIVGAIDDLPRAA